MFDHCGWGTTWDGRQDGVDASGSLSGSKKEFLIYLYLSFETPAIHN